MYLRQLLLELDDLNILLSDHLFILIVSILDALKVSRLLIHFRGCLLSLNVVHNLCNYLRNFVLINVFYLHNAHFYNGLYLIQNEITRVLLPQ